MARTSALFILLLVSSLATCYAGYSLVDNFSGSSFFDNFDFFTGGDPTHGYVTYVGGAQASTAGYTSVNNNIVYIRSDHVSVSSGSGRNSVRITSKKSYTGGLFLFDVIHMPYGCGNWPAIWTVGPNWPNSGEIDVIEGVNTQAKNAMTLHSKAGCIMPNIAQTGTQSSSNCDVNANGNQGCGVTDARTNSYGAGFNSNGGGVHALQWTTGTNPGIKIWFFPRNAIPADIKNGSPNPDTWGNPSANFPLGANCPSSYFQNHQIVVDNTFCGDWAGAVFGSMGCSGSCNTFVQNNPGAFNEAYWAINSFKVYQSSGGSVAATSASASSSSGQSTSGCGSGLSYCPGNKQCYNPSQYVCGTVTPWLCPSSAPHFCNGNACCN